MKTATKKNRFKRIGNSNYLYRWLLCGAMVFSGFLPVSAGSTVDEYGTSYEVVDGVLNIMVPAGKTNSVDTAQMAVANDNSVTDIVKTGLGALRMDDKTAIPNYTGDIHINQGTWQIACTNALGKLSSSPDGSGVGGVFVADGATLAVIGSDRYISNIGKKITISGDGVNGEGALSVQTTGLAYLDQTVFGRNIELAGDAAVRMNSTVNLYLLRSTFTFNGHKLRFEYDINNTKFFIFGGSNGGSEYIDPGELEFTGFSIMSLQGENAFLGNTGKITFNDFSWINNHSMHGRYEWPMVWNSDGTNIMRATTTSNTSTNRASWHGPVRLDKTMKVSILDTGSFGLFGPVSGVGGLDFSWGKVSKPEFPTNFVNLACAGSTFTGGVRAEDLLVNVMATDAIPANGGAFALTNSIVKFEPRDKYMLPDGIIHVDEERSVTGGWGKWKTLVKTGSGTVNYDSAIGAEVLDLREGVLKVSMQPSTYAGLIEGVEYFESTSECQKAVNNKDIAYTNGVVKSPYLMNTAMHKYWTTERPAWDTEGAILANCTTYSGYMWNREPTTVRWTFACNVANSTTLHFDNELKFAHSTQSGKPIMKVTFEVTPGWHSIRIGNYAAYKGNETTQGGYSTSSSDKDWKSNGLRWDRLGRDTIDPANFEILEDPGDGSLLTWAIPGEEVFYPGTEMLIEQIKFNLVKFTGGTLHLNEITNTVTEAEGIPLVAGTGKLIIESKWTVDAAEIANAEVSDLSFGFGADAELEIENSSAAKSMTGTREWTVIKSAEDITGSITVKDEDMAKRWSVKVDGNEVKLKYRPFGTAVIIR